MPGGRGLQDSKRYCYCRKKNDKRPMVACDKCNEWYHLKCVNMVELPGANEPYYCPTCIKKVKQCANPDCLFEARDSSKYCSDSCGDHFNRLRYSKFFIPKWENLKMNHSSARINKMKDLEKLEEEKKNIMDLIGKLKGDKEELEEIIKSIKNYARRMSDQSPALNQQEESDSDIDEDEESTVSDQSKTFCITCGIEQPAEKAFKHWMVCHKKQEAFYNFSSDVPIKYSCPTDENPQLYCQKLDKKTKRFCMNLESACPQHSNWQSDPDEICGCPLSIMQKLTLNGDFCTKLKKDCTIHYNWDRFRLASKDMERVQAFMKLDFICDKINRVSSSLNDTYGGVVGVMLHDTIDNNVD